MSAFVSPYLTLGFHKYSTFQSLCLAAHSAAIHCYYTGALFVLWYFMGKGEHSIIFRLNLFCTACVLGLWLSQVFFHWCSFPSIPYFQLFFLGCSILNLFFWGLVPCSLCFHILRLDQKARSDWSERHALPQQEKCSRRLFTWSVDLYYGEISSHISQ